MLEWDIILPVRCQALIAEALGITVDEAQAARIEGKSVAELAEEKNISVDDLR